MDLNKASRSLLNSSFYVLLLCENIRLLFIKCENERQKEKKKKKTELNILFTGKINSSTLHVSCQVRYRYENR
jgi:hypothetical protein